MTNENELQAKDERTYICIYVRKSVYEEIVGSVKIS